MISENLFQEILLYPQKNNDCRKLTIISGFATANMADRHLDVLAQKDLFIDIELIIGMTVRSGIQKAQHLSFKKLVNSGAYGSSISCRYVNRGVPVHSKYYVWRDTNGRPLKAFLGSANYTRTGFGKAQMELMTEASFDHFDSYLACIKKNTINCLDDEADALAHTHHYPKIGEIEDTDDAINKNKDSVTLTLLQAKNKDIHKAGGLNWGQRNGRDSNQAYIPIPKNIYQGDFFPERGEQFTVITDDGFPFIVVRAQDNGKALETTQSNAYLGEYFRRRIGVNSGAFVTKEDLLRYGRTDVTFTKIDDETYHMDFTPNLKAGDDIT